VEKPLLDTLFAITLDICREAGRPLQVHAGFGDPDIDLPTANPALLRPILEDARWRDVRIVVLHLAYPYFREAAFMAAVWPQVYVDCSLALPFLGPAVVPLLVEILSLAPSSKLMYGSDVGALPDLLAVVADWGRDAVADALTRLVADGGVTERDAGAVGAAILGGNAHGVYRLAT
jgi:predicted TIM-barrel fold metal-dependent hydrolase